MNQSEADEGPGRTLQIAAHWGQLVDVSGDVWHLSDDEDHVVRFDRVRPATGVAHPNPGPNGLDDAFRQYTISMVKTLKASSVYTIHGNIARLLCQRPVLDAFKDQGPVLLDVAYRCLLPGMELAQVRNRVSCFRKFYVWAAERAEDRGWTAFDQLTSMQLRGTRVKSSTPGRAVLRNDPDEGPLAQEEYLAVRDALLEDVKHPDADLAETIAATLMFVLGCNPANLKALREEDLVVPERDGGNYVLRVPRIKKRGQGSHRDGFVERELLPAYGAQIWRLVEANRELAPPDPAKDEAAGRPLFRRASPSTVKLARGQVAGAVRVNRKWFAGALDGLVTRHGLKSVLGSRLVLTPRRLRYTFASREAARGTRPEVLMRLLDHSNWNSLLVYYNARLELVERLDAAMGERLAPMARLFLGQAGPGDRHMLPGVPDDWQRDLDLHAAPFACLRCRYFRPHGAGRLREMALELDRRATALEADRAPTTWITALGDLSAAASAAAGACHPLEGHTVHRTGTGSHHTNEGEMQ